MLKFSFYKMKMIEKQEWNRVIGLDENDYKNTLYPI
jgi:hypothetical protein